MILVGAGNAIFDNNHASCTHIVCVEELKIRTVILQGIEQHTVVNTQKKIMKNQR